MKNRDRIIARINAGVSPLLKEELEFRLTGIDREAPEEGERPNDLSNAFDEAQDLAETEPGFAPIKKECRQILIDLGYYRVMTQKEIDNTLVTSGTKWNFKMNGVPYTMGESPGFVEWLEQ